MRTLKRSLYIAAWIILLLVVPSAFSGWLRDRVATGLAPLAHMLIQRNRGLNGWLESIRQIPQLRAQNTALEEQVITLQQRLAEDDALRQENATLTKELGVSGVAQSTPKVLAEVILQGSDPLDRTLTVNVGAKQGVKVGQPAVYQGTLIGRVSGVSETTATVRLITSSKSIIQAWVSDSRQKGLLVGDGTEVSLTDIAQGISVPKQSGLETDGLGGSLPQGIQIGQVGDTLSRPSELAQRFQVALPNDPATLESFFILQTTPSS